MQKRRSRRSGVEFVRFYPGAWRNGCALLSLEEEALYLRICAFRWDTGHLVPSEKRNGRSCATASGRFGTGNSTPMPKTLANQSGRIKAKRQLFSRFNGGFAS